MKRTGSVDAIVAAGKKKILPTRLHHVVQEKPGGGGRGVLWHICTGQTPGS